MKMFLGNTPIKSLHIKHYEMDTNDATIIPSDLQVGVTCYARGAKVVGTGKCFSFASYGGWRTNFSDIIPMIINTILISSTEHPVKMTVPTNKMVAHDFTIAQEMAEVIVDGVAYPITVSVIDGELMIDCEKTINLQVFIGKDEYA